MRARLGYALVFVAACKCGASTLGNAQPKISVAPGALAFVVYVGASSTQSVTLANGGTAGDTVSVALSGPSVFSTSSTSMALGPGSTSVVPVIFTPTVAGTFTATLALTDSAGTLEVAITGAALAPLVCAPTGPCDTAVFVADAGACEHTQLADATACTGDPCLVDTKCVQGACLGTPSSCDDHDACTIDYCVSGQGCMHLDNSASCNGGVPCQIYGCDPSSGCTQSTAPDGTLCSSGVSCQMAEVCVVGKCLGVTAPDGTPCTLTWDPCVDAACLAGACRSAVAEALVPGQLLWNTWFATSFGPIGPFAIDDAGVAYFLAGGPVQSSPDGGLSPMVYDIVALDACGAVRWSNDGAYADTTVMVQGDEVIGVSSFGLTGIDRATGITRWTRPLSLAFRPAAMSAQGTIYALADLDGGEVLVAIDRNGSSLWDLPVGFGPVAYLAVDAAGDVFNVVVGPEWSIDAYAPSGASLWSGSLGFIGEVGTGCNYSAAVGETSLWVNGLSFALDGGGTGVSVDDAGCPSSPVLIDAAGDLVTVSAAGVEKWNGSTGAPVWGNPFYWATALTLANDGTVFALGQSQLGPADAPYELAAIEGDRGTLLWSVTFPAPYGLSQPLLNPAGSVIVAIGDGVAAYFAGRNLAPPTDAPWYAPRGTNDGRNAAAP